MLYYAQADTDRSLFTIGGFLIFFGVTTILASFAKLKRKRRVEDLASSKIGSAAAGLAEFQGFAWPLRAPIKSIKGHLCAHYRFRVEISRKSNRTLGKSYSSGFQTEVEFSSDDGFVIFDGTGVSLFEQPTHKFRQKMVYDLRSETFYEDDIPEETRERLFKMAKFKLPEPPAGQTQRWRIVEEHILLGAPVLAIGDFKPIARKDETQMNVYAGLSTFRERVLHQPPEAPTRVPRQLYEDKGGLASAYLEISHQELAKEFLVEGEKELEPSSIKGKLVDSTNHALFITDSAQTSYLQNSGLPVTFMVIGGAFMIVLGLFIFLYPFTR